MRLLVSLPAWGAWIEIIKIVSPDFKVASRSPHGERGLKFVKVFLVLNGCRRSPHGERGLKSVCTKSNFLEFLALKRAAEVLGAMRQSARVVVFLLLNG